MLNQPESNRPSTDPKGDGDGWFDPELEQWLAQPVLRRAGPMLDQRVQQLFNQQRRSRWWPTAAAAAVLVGGALSLVIALHGGTARVRQVARLPSTALAAEGAGRPETASLSMQIEQDESRVVDDGVIGDSGNVPLRQIRRQTIRDIWYIDPKTHAHLLVRIPAEQIVVEKTEAY